MRAKLATTLTAICAATFLGFASSPAQACPLRACPPAPQVESGYGTLTAAYFEAQGPDGHASNNPPAAQPYHWRLRTQCQVTDPNVGGCKPGQAACGQPPGRVVVFYIVQRQRVVLADRSAVDGDSPPVEAPVGS